MAAQVLRTRQIGEWVRAMMDVMLDGGLPPGMRLEAAVNLLTAGDRAAQEACVAFLDRVPAADELGQRYRELVVTSGGPVEALRVILGESDLVLRRAAAAALGETGDASAVVELMTALERQLHGAEPADADLRIVLLEALGRLHRPGDPRIALAAADALADEEEEVRVTAATLLRQLGADAAAAIPALLALLEHPDSGLRLTALELLPELAPAGVYRPRLLRLMTQDEDELLRWVARYALAAA